MELQWLLILFTTFISASAGLFAAQGCYALAGEGRKAQLPALITSVVIMAIGGIAVFFHLTHPDRLFIGFGHITSGITQEFIAIVATFYGDGHLLRVPTAQRGKPAEMACLDCCSCFPGAGCCHRAFVHDARTPHLGQRAIVAFAYR